MKRFLFIFISVVLTTVCVSCTGNTKKQYNLGGYVFVQRVPGISMYTCSIDSREEAYELYKIMYDDFSNNQHDISKSKLYQKYGMVINPHFLVKPYAKSSSGDYIYEDYAKYHIECMIETREEYEAFKNEYAKKKNQAKTRVESFL